MAGLKRMMGLVMMMVMVVMANGMFTNERDVHAHLRQKWKELNIQYCQMFPVLSPIPANYQPLTDLINQFSANITQLFNMEQTSSLSANLIYDQDILWSQSWGLKNLSDPTSAPNADSKYMIGSNTKLFTTLLGLIAQDKGMLSFTDEVVAHVPEFVPINPFPSRRSINFNQLASHMAGMPRECPCNALGSDCNVSNAEMFARLQNITLVNPPGFVPSYSNSGFAVLGHAIEEIWGSTWDDLIQQEILGPLGMTNSGTSIHDPKFPENLAVGYTNTTVSTLMDIGWESPAGSMFSSTNDMAKFVSFFFRDNTSYMAQPNQILDSLSIREWRQPRYINVDLSGFGLPWEIYNSPIIYTKGGAIGGYLSLTVTIPQLKLGMILLQSSDTAATYGEVFALWAASFVKPFAQILQDIAPPPYIPASFSSLMGTYLFANTTIVVSILKTTYYPYPAVFSDGSALPLLYISDNVYKITTQGFAMDCDTAQSGIEQYVYFTTSPPSFTIPGLYPGMVGIRVD